MLPMAKALGLGVTAWSPLAAGLLTGKYRQQGGDSGPKRGDATAVPHHHERTLSIADRVVDVAEEIGCPPPRWRWPGCASRGRSRSWAAEPAADRREHREPGGHAVEAQLRAWTRCRRLCTATRPTSPARDGVRGSVYGGMRDRIDDPGRLIGDEGQVRSLTCLGHSSSDSDGRPEDGIDVDGHVRAKAGDRLSPRRT